MQIKVLGQGCAKCAQLYEAVVKVIQELEIAAEVIKVQNMKDIVRYGVMRTPALVINEEVKVVGKVPTMEELKNLIMAEK